MSKALISILTLIIFVFTSACSNQDVEETLNDIESKPNFETEVVYGEDDRKDYFEVLDANIKTVARSTMGIIEKNRVVIDGNNARIQTRSSNLCPGEKFEFQRKGPSCSAFLVGADLVLTAAHCVRSIEQCKSFNFIFDYAVTSPGHDPANIPTSSVYSCKQVIGRELTSDSQDWALIQLDRPVADRRPLEIEREQEPRLGTPLTIVGHPSSLPSKIARGGKIHKVENKHFVADLDSFGGNSGSAVFNANTLKVEGILVRGRRDYKFENGCFKVNVCEEGLGGQCLFPGNPLKGEHVSKTLILADLIPNLDEETDSPTPPSPPEPNEPEVYISKVMTPIPDSIFRPISSTIKDVPHLNGGDLKVRLVLEHTYISDLRISLVSPSGKEVMLHRNTGRRVRNIIGVYGGNLASYQPLESLGAQPTGDWTLKVQDRVPLDRGFLIEWEVIPGS